MRTFSLTTTVSTAALALLAACSPGPADTVNSYQDCVNAGYPVMESYPTRCQTPDGRTFTNPEQQADISVEQPQPDTEVQSPLTVKGEARGTWYFEADFPLRIEDQNGNTLAEGFAQAEGEWMTEDFVPFTATVTWQSNYTGPAELVLEKANASGDPGTAAELHIPIRIAADNTNGNDDTLSTEQQADAEQYIRNNIGDLTEEEEVLGGTFFVTDLTWESDNTARVTFEDGHNMFVARAVLGLTADGSITVEEFTTTEENPAP